MKKKLSFPVILFIIAGGLIVIIAISTFSGKSDFKVDPAIEISNRTGVSYGNVNSALRVIEKYGLSDQANKIIVDHSAMVASMTSSGSNSGQLKFVGFGNTIENADSFAHILEAWNIQEGDLSNSLDILYSRVLQGTLRWSQFSDALIQNGPKLENITSLSDATVFLVTVSKVISPSEAVSYLSMIGSIVSNPNNPLNNLGNQGNLKNIIKNKGLIKGMEALNLFLNKNN